MDLELLINFFSQGVFTHLPAVVYSAQLIARTFMGILNAIGFNFETFTKLLSQANIKLQETLVKELLEVAGKGVDELSDWIQEKVQTPEIKQASGELIATQADDIGSAFDEAVKTPEKRQLVAQKASESLKEVGSITENISFDFATILLDPAHRAEWVRGLQQEFGVHPIQEQIAEEYSKIIASKQIIEGEVDARQTQKASKHSTIEKSSQSVRVTRDDQSKNRN